MTRALLTTTAILILASPAAAQEIEPNAGRIADRILEALVQTNGVPGMAASVWRDGREVWAGAAGVADLETGRAADTDTVFRLASVSKLFAATAAARLAEQGRLDLDAPVQDDLPWLINTWPAISARQLASHTSGLPHYEASDEDRGGSRYATARDAVGIFSGRDLLSEPGVAYSYSSWGYTLLSAEIEEVTGQGFLEHISQVIAPGLAIGQDATDSTNPHASAAYEFTDGGGLERAAPHDYSYTWAGGGLGATAPALAQWGARVLDNQVVSDATFEAMLVPTPLADGLPAGEDRYTVGFGWRGSVDADGRRLAHHAGTTIGARSVLVLYPDQEAAVSVLSNASWVSSIESTGQMLAAPFLPVVPVGATVPCPTTASHYEGTRGDAAISGEARFSVEDGVCIGEITLDPESDWTRGMNDQPQGDAVRLPIIAVIADGGLARAALVTPIGVYDLRSEDGVAFVSPLGGGRSLRLSLH